MENLQDDSSDDKDNNGGAMVTFAWRPSNSMPDGELVNLVELAGNFTEWKPIKMTPPPASNPGTMSSSVSSDCAAAEDLGPKSNLNHLGYWTLQRFLSPGSYEYKYVVTSTNEENGGAQNVVWLHDATKESKPDGLGGEGRNNVLQVEDFHNGKGGSISLSRTVSHDEAVSGTSDISDDDTDDDISIIQKEDGSGDGWVILSRKRDPVSQEETSDRERQPSDDSDQTEKLSKRSSESSIEIIERPESPLSNKELRPQGTEISKRESHSRVSTTTPVRSPGCDIERKFIAPSDYQTRLENLGFVPAKHFREEILDDCYYEFISCNTESVVGSLENQYLLLSNDHWLRQRNGDWELKYPVNADHASKSNSDAVGHLVSHYESQKFGKMVLYHQTSCPEDILSKLKLITSTAIKDGDSLSDLLTSGILRPLSKLQTSRNCFKYGGTASEMKTTSGCDVNIIVEMTSWGCCIGEIEVIVESINELSLATEEIDRLANVLGFEELDLAKMAEYENSTKT